MRKRSFTSTLLTKLGSMKIKNAYLKRVQPKDFDAALLKRLCREGKLFVYLEPEIDEDMFRHEVLDYVQKINGFVSDDWKEEIDNLWKTIVEESCFQDCLIMKNGLQAGHMNRYCVTNLICRLQNAGVYRQDVSMLSLHLKLEGIEKKNKFYKSSGNYELNRDARAFLRELLQRV